MLRYISGKGQDEPSGSGSRQIGWNSPEELLCRTLPDQRTRNPPFPAYVAADHAAVRVARITGLSRYTVSRLPQQPVDLSAVYRSLDIEDPPSLKPGNLRI